MEGTSFLSEDGRASMATALLMAHHAFRRDLARFAQALAALDETRIEPLREEWKYYRNALAGHHMMEDTRIFPHLASVMPELSPELAALGEEHHVIDPLLERGDRAFAALPDTTAAVEVIAELRAVLDPHLAREEPIVVPPMRGAREPGPTSDEEVHLHAEGYAWSCHGVAPEVLAALQEILSEPLRAVLPAARAAFDARCERVWGTAAAGASHGSIPDPA